MATPTAAIRQRAAQHQPLDVAWRGAKRHADANLTRALRDALRQHNENADQRQAGSAACARARHRAFHADATLTNT
jgi:hypothetical protein